MERLNKISWFFGTLLLSALLFQEAFSQAPSNFKYQAVIRDNVGAIIANEQVVLRFSIIEGSALGATIYREEHQETTSQFGLVNLSIGTGLVLAGDYYTIDWGGDNHFFKLELSRPSQGSGFVDMGTVELMSVPYSIYAREAGNVVNKDTLTTNELQTISLTNDTLGLSNNGGQISLAYLLDNTDNQLLSIVGDTISISNGNFVVLPPDKTNDADADPNNEIQGISLTNDSLYLSNGGVVYLGAYDNAQLILLNTNALNTLAIKQSQDSLLLSNQISNVSQQVSSNQGSIVTLGAKLKSDSLLLQNSINQHITQDFDLDSLNELQTLQINGDTIFLSGGNYILLPQDKVNDADADSTNEFQNLTISGDTLFISDGGYTVLPADEVNDSDNDTLNELQVISLNGDSILLSKGGYIILPTDEVNDADADSTNELQSLSILGDEIIISKGNSIILPYDEDTSSTNELQVLSISNDTVFLENGGFAVLPKDSVIDDDSDSLNEIQALSISNDTIYLENGGFIDLNQAINNLVSNNSKSLLKKANLADPSCIVSNVSMDLTKYVESFSFSSLIIIGSVSDSVFIFTGCIGSVCNYYTFNPYTDKFEQLAGVSYNGSNSLSCGNKVVYQWGGASINIFELNNQDSIVFKANKSVPSPVYKTYDGFMSGKDLVFQSRSSQYGQYTRTVYKLDFDNLNFQNLKVYAYNAGKKFFPLKEDTIILDDALFSISSSSYIDTLPKDAPEYYILKLVSLGDDIYYSSVNSVSGGSTLYRLQTYNPNAKSRNTLSNSNISILGAYQSNIYASAPQTTNGVKTSFLNLRLDSEERFIFSNTSYPIKVDLENPSNSSSSTLQLKNNQYVIGGGSGICVNGEWGLERYLFFYQKK